MVLIAKDKEELHTLIEELDSQGKEAVMSINIQKTKILNKKKNGNTIKIMNEEIENVEEVIYLGQLILQDSTKKEIDRRVTLTWNKYWSLKKIFKGPFMNKNKSEIFNSCVLPTLTYGLKYGR